MRDLVLMEKQQALAELMNRAHPRAIPDHALCFFMDGNKWCCVNGDFVNVQESPCGFGDTFDAALADLQVTMDILKRERRTDAV